MTFLNNLCIGVDQLANVLSGGNPDSTISARVGYHLVQEPSKYWEFLANVIDSTFKPIDGVNHCITAYATDNEDYSQDSPTTSSKVLLAVIVVISCGVLAIPIKLFSLFDGDKQ